MHRDDDNPEPTPQEIYDLLIGYWKTGILKAAIELDVFSGISAGENTAEILASSRGVGKRGMRVLLDGLCGLRLLSKEKGNYVLPPVAEQFLVKGKPSYLGGAAKAYAPMDDWGVMGRIEEAIQKGGALQDGERDPRFWEEVAEGLVPLGLAAGEMMCDILEIKPDSQAGHRVLDIACGSGVYGYAVLQRDRAATVTDFDLEDVLQVAEKVATEMGVVDRVTFHSGNIESPDFGESAFDMAIISHYLQAYNPEMIRAILGKIYQALVPGGRVVIHEFVPDEERASKSLPLLFAVYLFMVTAGGGTYTFSEFSQWLSGAGFRKVTMYDLPSQTSIIVAYK
jgi:C-methyltransferase